MRIAYCIAGTRHSGGMERVLANKGNWLAAHGHEVYIITTDQNGERPFFHLDEKIRLIDLGIGYEDNNGNGFLDKLLRYPFKQFRHRERLAKTLLDIRPDVTVSMFCNDASFLPQIKDGSRKVLEIHFSRFKRLQYGRKGIWRIADRFRTRTDLATARRYDRFVVLTEEDSHNWPGLGNLQVIPNARSFHLPTPSPLASKEVLAVGRLCHQKGFDRLLDVWEKVHTEAEGWRLRITGDGEYGPLLLESIRERGLEGSVEIGSATSEEMPGVYAGASVYVMTSRYEGLPMALLEAQGAGLPIVSCDCKCGPRDIVEHGKTGFISEGWNAEEMAGYLLRLIRDDDLRLKMGRAAYAASERYSEEAVMERWTELFETLRK